MGTFSLWEKVPEGRMRGERLLLADPAVAEQLFFLCGVVGFPEAQPSFFALGVPAQAVLVVECDVLRAGGDDAVLQHAQAAVVQHGGEGRAVVDVEVGHLQFDIAFAVVGER